MPDTTSPRAAAATPFQLEPLTPAQQRARRAQQRAFIAGEQAAGRLPTPASSVPLQHMPQGGAHARPVTQPILRGRGQPATKRFEAHELRRVPVEVSVAARAVIDASSAQGRLFPQALAEVFGEHPNIVRAKVDLAPKRAYFPLHPSEIQEMHPVTGAEPQMLVITAQHVDAPRVSDYRWLVNAADLASLHPRTHHVTISAVTLAQELLRLYPHGAPHE